MEYLYKPNISIKITENIKIKLSELLYLTGFSIYTALAVLQTTMFNVYINNEISKMIRIFFITIVIVKILLFDAYNKKQLLLIFLISISYIGCWLKNDYSLILDLVFLIIGSNNISLKKIVKMHFYISMIITILAIIAVNLGIIEHIIYYRNGMARYAFGSIYCTDFAARIFYLIVSYCYIKFSKLSNFNILVFMLLGGFVFYYSDARLDSLSIFITSIIFLYIIMKRNLNTNINLFNNFIIKSILIFSVPLCAIFSIILTNMYSLSNNKMVLLNQILSRRLYLGKMGINMYGFKLLGQKITMIGHGGTNGQTDNYFFIDCSYLNIALRFGIIILIILCSYCVIINKKCFKNKEPLIPIIISIIAINSLVAHHFIDIAYNPFIIALFATIESNEYFTPD